MTNAISLAPAAAVAAARRAQEGWRSTPLRERLQVIRRFRGQLAGRARTAAGSVSLPQRRDAAETLTTEVLPLNEYSTNPNVC